MTNFLDKQMEKFSAWSKKRTMINFSDWGVFALFVMGFIIGLVFFIILFLNQSFDLPSLVSIIVLWITAIAILRYTTETYRLRQISQRQLEQNEREELIRNRAYLTVQNCHLSRNDIDLSTTIKVAFNLINKGTTPAQKITVKRYFASSALGEKRFGENLIGAFQNHLVPDHVHIYQFPFSDQNLNFASEMPISEKFLVIEVTYSDYHGRQHILTSHYQIRSKEPESVLLLKERHEKDL